LKAREGAIAAAEKRGEELAKREAELAELEKLDELALLEKRAKASGRSLEDVLRHIITRVANGGKETQEDRETRLEREAKEARAAAEEAKQAVKDWTEKQEAAAIMAANERIIMDYRDDALSTLSEELHPHLSTVDPEYVARRALQVADQVAGAEGVVPDVADVLQFLEDEEREQFEKRAARLKYSRGEQKPAPVELGRGPDGRFQPAKQAPPRNVTNQMSASRTQSPIDWSKLSERERIELAGEEVLGPLMRRG